MIATILVTALALWGGMFLMRKGDYGSVRITVNGLEYGTYSLAKDQVIAIGDTNVCEIKNGKIKMTEADCHDLTAIPDKMSCNSSSICFS